VQDLYLKELRSYKAPPAVRSPSSTPNLRPTNSTQAKDAHVGAVKEFRSPAAPTAPALPDLASELSSYDAEQPTSLASSSTEKVSSEVEEGTGGGAKEFLEFLEKPLPKPEVHH
jgi:F-type H+-transporting ATPase subunit h